MFIFCRAAASGRAHDEEADCFSLCLSIPKSGPPRTILKARRNGPGSAPTLPTRQVAARVQRPEMDFVEADVAGAGLGIFTWFGDQPVAFLWPSVLHDVVRRCLSQLREGARQSPDREIASIGCCFTVCTRGEEGAPRVEVSVKVGYDVGELSNGLVRQEMPASGVVAVNCLEVVLKLLGYYGALLPLASVGCIPADLGILDPARLFALVASFDGLRSLVVGGLTAELTYEYLEEFLRVLARDVSPVWLEPGAWSASPLVQEYVRAQRDQIVWNDVLKPLGEER